MLILTLDCRDNALHFQLYDWGGKSHLAGGRAQGVAQGGACVALRVPGRPEVRREGPCRDHAEALSRVLGLLTDPGLGILADLGEIRAVGHRVPHGGTGPGPLLLDRETLPRLREAVRLAPARNAAALKGVEAALELLRGVPQVALFDSSFHATLPEVAYRYPVPQEWCQRHGVRRYGCHGHAHRYAAQRGAAHLGRPLGECSIVSVYTGEGTSLCLVVNGRSLDTSMGFSALEGVMMETACGDIDPGIVPFMIQEGGLSPQEMEAALGTQSGSRGIAGGSVNGPGAGEELRRSPRGRLALEMEGYRLRKYLGAYLAVGNPGAVVFSYGEGWGDWPARGMALRELGQFGIRFDPERDREATLTGRGVVSADDSRIPVLVLPSGEDEVVRAEVAGLLGWG